jgi:hypothetical protein
MVKQTKSHRLKEKMMSDIKYLKQTTLGSVQGARKAEASKAPVPEKKKQIEITGITASTREDVLALNVGFRLLPSRTAFSKVASDLFFDEQKVDSLRLSILHGPLATEESEFSSVLDMTGIPEGKHTLRVEMYEPWASDEKLTTTSKEVTLDYVPVKREDRLIRVPIVKSVAGADMDIVSETQKNVYSEIAEEMRQESEGRRDYW